MGHAWEAVWNLPWPVDIALPSMIRRCDSDFRKSNWDCSGLGGTQRLPRQIGLSKALPMLLTGKKVGAKEAFQIELVDAVCSAVEADSTVRACWESIPTGILGQLQTRCFVQAGTGGVSTVSCRD